MKTTCKPHRTAAFLALLAWAVALAAAQDADHSAIPLGSTRVVTPRGIKIIDRRTAPAPSGDAIPRVQGQDPVPADGPFPAPAPLGDTFLLHSRSTATKVIFLDFDGHVGLEPGGTYPPFNFEGDAATFSDAEKTRIQEVWRSVAEDFIPFDVDVTTQQPPIEDLKKTGGSDTRWGIRCVISPGPWPYSWGYVDSFNWNTDYECQAYTGDYSWIWIADSISHEVGHTLGLDEHGQKPGDGTYYEGHGSGNTYWAPIMGWTNMSVPYGLSQWDKGEYLNATPKPAEDSLAIITTQNGFGYRPDDHGSTTGTATPVALPTTPAVVAEGVIEQRTDVDYFSFTLTGPGTVSLVINGDVYPSDASHRSSNLDVLAKIHNAAGTVLHTSNPAAEIHASFTNLALAAGTYYLSIDGTGLNTPTDGYSDYGSLGYYSITASMTDTTPPALTSSAIADDKSGGPIAAGTLVTYTVTFSEDMDASTVSAADFGNAGSAAVTIGTVTETSPTSGVFTVPVTPTSAGTLQLKVLAGAVLKDVAGNALNTASAIADDTTLTVDGTLPTLTGVAIVDNKGGGPITPNTLVTYTVTFSEDMDSSTVSAADFGNAGGATVTIGTVTETTPGVFTVPVTPTTAGTLQLKVLAGAVLKDVAGNALNTSAAITDDTTLAVIADYAAWSGNAAFDADSNKDGVKDGLAWLLGAANPSANAGSLLPKPTREAGKLVMIFRCLKTANRGTAVMKLQHSNDLGKTDPWTSHEAVVPDVTCTVNGVYFNVTPDVAPAYFNVRAEIPASAASSAGILFGRLSATEN